MEIKQEPIFDFSVLIGGGSILTGLLLFLICLHIVAINASGGTAEVLSTTFRIFLTLYLGVVIFCMAGVVIHLIKWLAWAASTPKWLKDEQRGKQR